MKTNEKYEELYANYIDIHIKEFRSLFPNKNVEKARRDIHDDIIVLANYLKSNIKDKIEYVLKIISILLFWCVLVWTPIVLVNGFINIVIELKKQNTELENISENIENAVVGWGLMPAKDCDGDKNVK